MAGHSNPSKNSKRSHSVAARKADTAGLSIPPLLVALQALMGDKAAIRVPRSPGYLRIKARQLTEEQEIQVELSLVNTSRSAKKRRARKPIRKTRSTAGLTKTEQMILDQIGSTPLTGPKIAVKADHDYDATRHILSQLVKREYIANNHDGRGYFRA